jgi:hypothetical protein
MFIIDVRWKWGWMTWVPSRLLHRETKSVRLAHFALGVKDNVQTKSNIFIGVEVEFSPKGFPLGVELFFKKQLFCLTPSANKCQ